MNLLKTLASVSGLTLLSRITGLIRESLTMSYFGAGATTDAFLLAFRIPNMLRRFFAEGAFSQAFTPALGHSLATEGQTRTHILVNRVATLLLWATVLVSAVGILGASGVMWLMLSKVESGTPTYDHTRLMMQIMFPYIVCMSLVALSSGILNTFKNFRTPAFTPVLLNLCMIGAALGLSRFFTTPIYALTVGVMAGGLLQLAWQIPALKKVGMLPRVGFDIRAALADDEVRRVLKMMAPAVLAVSVAQISLIINSNWAASLGAGRVTWINGADRLMEFPTALLGVALGTILLPSLTRANSTGDVAEYKRLLHWGLRLTLLLALPAAVGLATLAQPLIAAMYQYHRFTAFDVEQTAAALTMYAIGLIGLIAVKILSSAYFAKQDIKTPVVIAIGVLIATQAMNYVFVPLFSHAGLSLSIGLGACLNALILTFLLIRKGVLDDFKAWAVFKVKIILAASVMGAVGFALQRKVDWLHLNHGMSAILERVALLLGIIAVCALVYFAVLFVLGFRLRDFRLVSKT